MKVDNSVSDKVFQYIDALAEKLGVASEYIFTTLVRQQVMDGIMSIAIMGLFVGIVGILLFIGVKWFKKRDANFDLASDFHPSYIMFGIGGIISFFLLLTMSFDLKESILQITNPEYYAIKEILDTVKK